MIVVHSCVSSQWLGSLREGIRSSNTDVKVEAMSQPLTKRLINRLEHEQSLDKHK